MISFLSSAVGKTECFVPGRGGAAKQGAPAAKPPPGFLRIPEQESLAAAVAIFYKYLPSLLQAFPSPNGRRIAIKQFDSINYSAKNTFAGLNLHVNSQYQHWGREPYGTALRTHPLVMPDI